MKIGIIIDTISPFYIGGYETRAYELARRLASQHDLTVFTSAPAPQWLEGIVVKNIRPQAEMFSSNGFRKPIESIRFAAGVLALTARPLDLDIIDCNATPFVHIAAAKMVARRNGVPLVVTAHEALAENLWSFVNRGHRWTRRAQLMLLRKVYSAGLDAADHVIASSELAHTGLFNEGVRNISVTHGGVNEIGVAKRRYRGRIGTVGRLVPIKRTSVIINAFGDLIHRGLAQQLTIVGAGPERTSLEELARSLGLQSRVRFYGAVDDDERDRILKDEIDVFVSASPREGLSIATLEAMAAGNPCVVTSVPECGSNGALEYVRHGQNGQVCNGTSASLVDAIRSTALSDDVYCSMSTCAVETARRYTWDDAAKELLTIYSAVIESSQTSKGGQRSPLTVT
jgi:glycosyltransferase involved in cell wall biosynthesis